MTYAESAREKARSLLEMFAVHQPPVDVARIAEQLGFAVLPYEFPDETSGVLLIREGIKAIGVNKNHAPVRQRFSIAHELGHYLSGHEDYSVHGGDEKIRVDGSLDYTTAQHQMEREANAFAAELLMPERMLRADVHALGLDGPALARRYQVSEQAMWIQLVALKLAGEYSEG